MAAQEQVDEIVQTAKAIEPRLRYPIHNFKELADALGGEDAEVDFAGQKRKVGQVRRLLPPEYFPIDSTEDLIAKAVELRSRAEPGWPGDLEPGTELGEVPPDAGQPSVPESEFPQPGHGLRVKGWRKGS